MSKVSASHGSQQRQDSPMVDEMLDGGQMDVMDSEDSAMAGGPNSSLMSDLAASDRTAHSGFQNDFGIDFFDDKDLQ